MKSIRELMAAMPELARFRERLSDPDWPTAAEVAAALGVSHFLPDAQGELLNEPLRSKARA